MNKNMNPYTHRRIGEGPYYEVGMIRDNTALFKGLRLSGEEAKEIAEALNWAYSIAYLDIISDLQKKVHAK